MKLEIALENGHWSVNGRKLNEMTQLELKFLNDFFIEVKNNEHES